MAETNGKRMLYVTTGVEGAVVDMEIPYHSFAWQDGILHVQLDDGVIDFSPCTLLHVSTVRLSGNVHYTRTLK